MIYFFALVFLIYGILKIKSFTKQFILSVENVEEKTREHRNEINLLNEKLKESFIQFDSIKDMNEDAEYCFYEYIVNIIYIRKYVLNEFTKELNNNFNCNKVSNITVTKLDKNSINKDNILNLINTCLLNNDDYRKKILINEDYYLTYTIDVRSSGEYSSVEYSYFKIKKIKENDLDLILEDIKEKGTFSFNLFVQNINEIEYNKYLNLHNDEL